MKTARRTRPRVEASPGVPATTESSDAKVGRVLECLDAARAKAAPLARERSRQMTPPGRGGKTTAADVGRRVLEGLAKGRAKTLKRSLQLATEIFDLAHADMLAGKPDRGRAGRISEKMNKRVSERHVLRILGRMFRVSDSVKL